MFKRFGGVPLITKTMQIDDPDVFKPRATRDEVLDLIYSDLDYAISVLRTPDQLNTAGEYGRISNTATLAFKAKLHYLKVQEVNIMAMEHRQNI